MNSYLHAQPNFINGGIRIPAKWKRFDFKEGWGKRELTAYAHSIGLTPDTYYGRDKRLACTDSNGDYWTVSRERFYRDPTPENLHDDWLRDNAEYIHSGRKAQ